MIKYCKQVAETLKGKVPGNKNNIPQFKEGFVISENETSRAFEHAKNNEASKAVMEIHTSRGQYNFDEKDPLFERAETIQKTQKRFCERSKVSTKAGLITQLNIAMNAVMKNIL